MQKEYLDMLEKEYKKKNGLSSEVEMRQKAIDKDS
jgi:hypothetical protein